MPDTLITVKLLKGEEWPIEIDESRTTVAELKKLVEAKANVSRWRQQLLFGGRTLLDDRTLASYRIRRNARLTLIVREPDNLRTAVEKALTGHFNADKVEQLAAAFVQQHAEIMSSMNLDTLERMAEFYVDEDVC